MHDGERLRQELRSAEVRVNEYFTEQVPTEVFRYTLNQMRTIRTLYELTADLPSGVQLKQLAEKLHVTPAAASEMVDTLVRKGAILRLSDPSDRRAVRLKVGDQLREKFESCERQLCELTDRFLATRTEAEVQTALKMAKAFAEFVADKSNFPEPTEK